MHSYIKRITSFQFLDNYPTRECSEILICQECEESYFSSISLPLLEKIDPHLHMHVISKGALLVGHRRVSIGNPANICRTYCVSSAKEPKVPISISPKHKSHTSKQGQAKEVQQNPYDLQISFISDASPINESIMGGKLLTDIMWFVTVLMGSVL